MSKKNLTITVDEVLIKQARKLSLDDDQSLSEWVTCLIVETVRKRSGRDAAKRRATAKLNRPFSLGGRPLTRDETHER
jgi:hypothetical protein